MHPIVWYIIVGALVFLIIQYLVKNGLFPPPLEQEPEQEWEDRP